MPSRCLISSVSLAIFILASSVTTAQEAIEGALAADIQPELEGGNWLQRNFIHPDDGYFDVSAWLSRGGFLPVPIVITEPAVDNGLGVAAVFLSSREPGDTAPPNITGVLGAWTGNDSEIYGAFHQGFYLDDRLRYVGVIADASINLDLFGGGPQGQLGYNVDGQFLLQNLRWRLGGSDFFVGGRWLYLDSQVSFSDGRIPPFEVESSFGVRVSGLGATVYYDTRDNTLTPYNGVNARLLATRYDQAIGSQFDFNNVEADFYGFHTPVESWTFGFKTAADFTDGDTPFFLLPAINLRGIPAQRYQGQSAISSELEITYNINDRWRILGFSGAGWTESDDLIQTSSQTKFTYGAGFRYKIAKDLGLDVGLDIAQGPEDTVVYLQFGHAWQLD